MRRPLTITLPDTLPHAGEGPWVAPWTRLVPLWRHAVWLMMLFVVCGLSLSVRLDVQRLQHDLERNDLLTREARVLNERLRLEWDVRRRSAALDVMAASLSLTHAPPLRIARPVEPTP